jgi:hypothetical protein
MGNVFLDIRNLDEVQLKDLLVDRLSEDFEIKPEVTGLNIVERKAVIIDFLLKAKPHVVQSGFTPEWFGVEVKNIYHQGRPKSGKINELFWQALSYAQSVFDGSRPPFVLVFVNDDYARDSDEFDRFAFMFVARFCQRGNVGKLQIEKTGYTISFDGNVYYRKRGEETHSGKSNAGLKRNVGNVSK